MSKGAIYLPTSSHPADRQRPNKTRWSLALLAVLFSAGFLLSRYSPAEPVITRLDAQAALKGSSCYQPEPRMPKGYNTSVILGEKDRIVNWLSEAVKIPTEVFDVMGPVDEDPKWQVIPPFHDFLEKSFPLVHKTLTRTIVDYALVYEWPGSDPSLKPIFLTAHQDVVPVLPSTLSQWIHPPYSGHYDGTSIWGRGSSDTKSSLISIMAAIEHLLETTDFSPKRGVILGFGSDEERGGQVGAPAISKYLVEKYGKDSISLLIDEGSGLMNTWGQQFALPAVAEKGHYDLGITVETLGGHSSVPPVHTGIGYISLLIAELERNPHEIILKETSPVYGYMTCAAAHAEAMPSHLRSTVIKTHKGDKKAWKNLPHEIIEAGIKGSSTGGGQGNSILAMMTTTQAADIINGGLKINALPEAVKVVVNHRVNVASNHAELEQQTIHTLLPVCKDFNLTLVGFDGKVQYQGNPTARVVLENEFGYYTDPAPISPTDASDADSAYTVMASTARGMWASRTAVSPDGKIMDLKAGDDLVMAPFMSTGNTDTRRYWDLTRNIYRFRYNAMETSLGAHTINEHTDANGVVEFARWYQAIILTMDQASNVA